MSWVTDNLENVLSTRNVIVNIHGAVKAVGLGLLVLFFVSALAKGYAFVCIIILMRVRGWKACRTI